MQVRGEQVKRRRERLWITQGELAERAGVHVNTITRIEQGDGVGVRMRTIRILAAALGCEPGDIAVADESEERVG